MDFVEHLKKYLQDEEIKQLIIALDQESLKAVILNNEKIQDEEFKNLFPLVKAHPLVPHAYIYDPHLYPLGKHLFFELGYYYILEPSSLLVAYFLNPTKDDVVLDVAAAPGGKALHASLMMENQGLIYANEINTSRSYILSSNVERMGRVNMVVTNNNIDDYLKKFPAYFSKIILDAPCSGSGMFRKSDLMKQDWTYQKVLSLAPLQKELLYKAYLMLQEGGTLVYSTCSFSYEEDEEVIHDLLSKTNAQIVELPENPMFYQSKVKLGIHLFPYLFSGEGHYLCLIRKPIQNEINIKKKIVVDAYDRIRKLCQVKGGYIYLENNVYYYLSQYVDIAHLHLVRLGLKLGQEEKYGFEYDFALSHYLTSFPLEYSLNDEEVKKYLLGESLPLTKQNKGTILLKYRDNGVSFGKLTSNRINNKYPKGLRKKIEINVD